MSVGINEANAQSEYRSKFVLRMQDEASSCCRSGSDRTFTLAIKLKAIL